MAEKDAATIESKPTLTPSTVVEKSCNTKKSLAKFIYTWVIDDFQAIFGLSKEVLNSALFDEDIPQKLQWMMKIDLSQSDGKIDFGIRQVAKATPKIVAAIEVAIMNPKGGKDKVTSMTCEMVVGKYIYFAHDRTIFDCTDKFIYDDKLTLRFTISLAKDDVISNSISSVDHLEPSIKLRDSLGRLLENESFADVTIVVELESFRAHKVVLAAQSDVFMAMFQHDMLESSKNQVKITDIRPEVFREALHFIYTGKIRDDSVLERMALELIVVADKYALDELKRLCEVALIRNISSEIAAETLIVAETHSVDRLKTRAIEFIKANIAEVSLTGSWCKLVSSYAHLVKVFSTKQKN